MTEKLPRKVVALYKFVPIAAPEQLQTQLQALGEGLDVKGTILLAQEGINATLVGPPEDLRRLISHAENTCGPIQLKWSQLDPANAGFHRFKIKLKPEIVSFGVAGLDVTKTGKHVDAQQWHDLLDDPDVVVIDTRNTYEVDIGTFPGAINPQTTNFREFPAWAAAHLDPVEQPRVAMFCTGGIRCEKASAHLRAQGFEEVYQLDGGVLNYFESEKSDNRWEGECFVFDQRVSVDAKLTQGQYQQCFACRHPLSPADLQSPEYEAGVRCPHCAQTVDEGREQRFRQRQLQIKLAKSRGEQHIGVRQKAKKEGRER